MVEYGLARVNMPQGANLRSSPESGANIIGNLPYGTLLSVIRNSGPWTRILTNNSDRQRGWVWTAYLAPADAPAPTEPAVAPQEDRSVLILASVIGLLIFGILVAAYHLGQVL